VIRIDVHPTWEILINTTRTSMGNKSYLGVRSDLTQINSQKLLTEPIGPHYIETQNLQSLSLISSNSYFGDLINLALGLNCNLINLIKLSVTRGVTTLPP
jgi:hypothetical protein